MKTSTPRIVHRLCFGCLVALITGCGVSWEKWDAALEGTKSDEVTWRRSGLLGSATIRADNYTNGTDLATAGRLYVDENFPWGGSVSFDMKGWVRAKEPATKAQLEAQSPQAFAREPSSRSRSSASDDEGTPSAAK